MKKILTMVSLLLCLTAMGAWGQGETDPGWSYDEGTQTLTLTSNDASGYDKLAIRAVMVGNQVTELKSSAFKNNILLEQVDFESDSQLGG